MNQKQTEFRKIVKVSSIFGSLQVFLVLVSIVRSKFVALFLGAEGLGILGLISSTIGLITGLTNFGIGTSAVREVTLANASDNDERISAVVSIVRRIVLITGLLGASLTVVFSELLSNITFGNDGFILSFSLISIIILFNQLNTGQIAILQGMQKVKYLAKASFWGSFFGLVINIPMYYYLGADGIVPSLIIASLSSLLLGNHFVRKLNIQKIDISLRQTYSEGKSILKLGFLISFNGLLVAISSYIAQLFINEINGMAEVGLYTAGFAIINTYVSLIFTAMATDYYPKLSAVAFSNELSRNTINQQAEISILILGPLVIFFLVFCKPIILILYSNRFFGIIDMVSWLSIAIFFKAAAWSIGYILLAKGANKTFFWNDFFGSIYLLILDLIGYYFWGLTGLGISFFVGYLIYFFQVYTLAKNKYEFSFSFEFIKIFAFLFGLALLTYSNMKYVLSNYSYYIGVVLFLFSLFYSFIEFNKRLDLRGFLKKLT